MVLFKMDFSMGDVKFLLLKKYLISPKTFIIICIQLEDIFLFRGPSVRSKNTLITGHVGGAGVSQPTCKTGTSFPIPLALTSLKKTHNPT